MSKGSCWIDEYEAGIRLIVMKIDPMEFSRKFEPVMRSLDIHGLRIDSVPICMDLYPMVVAHT